MLDSIYCHCAHSYDTRYGLRHQQKVDDKHVHDHKVRKVNDFDGCGIFLKDNADEDNDKRKAIRDIGNGDDKFNQG